MKKVLTVAFVFIAGLSMAACSNTLDGAGKDISEFGDDIQEVF